MDGKSKRPYAAIVWVGDKPGERVEVIAGTPEEARSRIKEIYGPEVTITIWNEEDANKPR